MKYLEDYLYEEYKPILDKMNEKSQNYKILKWMLEPVGKVISPYVALMEFGCFRLAARIADLRAMGIKINTQMVTDKDGVRYARYWIGRSDLW